MLERIVRYLDGFYNRHTGIKSAARTLLIAIVTAILYEAGLGDVVASAIGGG